MKTLMQTVMPRALSVARDKGSTALATDSHTSRQQGAVP